MTESLGRPPSLMALPSYAAGQFARRPRASAQQVLGEHGLATPEYGVLAALTDFGVLSQQQLAECLAADKSHVMRSIDRLEARDLVTRTPDPGDRRRHRVELTSSGRRLFRRLAAQVERAEAQHLAPLSATERKILVELLKRLLTNAEEG